MNTQTIVTADSAATQTKHSWEIREATHALVSHIPTGKKAEAKEIASFIVRACNSHYELLNACKVALAKMNLAMANDHSTGSKSGITHKDTVAMEAAIALAERGER